MQNETYWFIFWEAFSSFCHLSTPGLRTVSWEHLSLELYLMLCTMACKPGLPCHHTSNDCRELTGGHEYQLKKGNIIACLKPFCFTNNYVSYLFIQVIFDPHQVLLLALDDRLVGHMTNNNILAWQWDYWKLGSGTRIGGLQWHLRCICEVLFIVPFALRQRIT